MQLIGGSNRKRKSCNDSKHDGIRRGRDDLFRSQNYDIGNTCGNTDKDRGCRKDRRSDRRKTGRKKSTCGNITCNDDFCAVGVFIDISVSYTLHRSHSRLEEDRQDIHKKALLLAMIGGGKAEEISIRRGIKEDLTIADLLKAGKFHTYDEEIYSGNLENCTGSCYNLIIYAALQREQGVVFRQSAVDLQVLRLWMQKYL